MSWPNQKTWQKFYDRDNAKKKIIEKYRLVILTQRKTIKKLEREVEKWKYIALKRDDSQLQ